MAEVAEDPQVIQDALRFVLTPRQLTMDLEHLLSTKNSNGVKKDCAVMVWGPPGIGKTQIARQLAKLWGLRLIALHLAQFDPTDIKGIPVRLEDGRVIWVASSYLPQQKVVKVRGVAPKSISYRFPYAEDVQVLIYDRSGTLVFRHNNPLAGDFNDLGFSATAKIVNEDDTDKVNFYFDKPIVGCTIKIVEKAMLFLDELSAAVPEVQNASLSLIQDRRIGEYDVPDGVPMLAAGNRTGDSNAVFELTPPLRNRLCHLTLTVSVKEWIEDYAMLNGVRSDVIAWVRDGGSEMLCYFDPDAGTDGDCGFKTPRSIANMSDQIEESWWDDPVRNHLQEANIAGFVGSVGAQQFLAWRKVIGRLPKASDILAGRKVHVPDDMGPGERFFLGVNLRNLLQDLFDEHVRRKGQADTKIYKFAAQPKTWQTAVDAFCDFTDHLGEEITATLIHHLTTARDERRVSLAFFRGSVGFAKLAEKYQPIMTMLGR